MQSIYTDNDVCEALNQCTELDARLASAQRRLAELQEPAAALEAHERAVEDVLAGRQPEAPIEDRIAEARRNVAILKTAIERADQALAAAKNDAAIRIFAERGHELEAAQRAAGEALDAALRSVGNLKRVADELIGAGIDRGICDLMEPQRVLSAAIGDFRRRAGIPDRTRKAVQQCG